mgnify:CR=1 FL=1
MNCTPFVRQYGILKTNGVIFYAKGSFAKTICTGIQKTSSGNYEERKSQLHRNS